MSRPSYFPSSGRSSSSQFQRSVGMKPPDTHPNHFKHRDVHRKRVFCGFGGRYRPPDPLLVSPRRCPGPNFTVELRLSVQGGRPTRSDIEELIATLNLSPEDYIVLNSGPVAAKLYFVQWHCASKAIVSLWEKKLDHSSGKFTPILISRVIVPSDEEELRDRLKGLFVERIKGLLEGEAVTRCRRMVDSAMREIDGVSASLARRQKINAFQTTYSKKERLVAEKDLIVQRLIEFKAGLECILHLVGGEWRQEVVDKDREDGYSRVFNFKFDRNWEKIYHLIERERRRLDLGLPIYSFRREILHQIFSQQVLVLIGETGSGKSTQLAQFLADAGRYSHGSIICTQPRKIAAMTLADRVKNESYKCYEYDAISCHPSYSSTQSFCAGGVIFMTDHCLLQHCMKNRDLPGVSCIIVDEAHERSLNTDLLLALLKSLLSRRLDLRLIIMSATADANQFSEYFFGCGTFKVSGRKFPVDIRYVPCAPIGTTNQLGPLPTNIAPYVSDVVRMVIDIHRRETEGTILAFLTSPNEVEWACENFHASGAIGLPLHGNLSKEEQLSVFLENPSKRKVIFATNVAETSLTIPGVRYVVDSGLAKESRFEPGSGMSVLKVGWVSKSSANQRSGRAGRTGPGKCFRLYSEADYESMPSQQDPEIRRVHLGIAVLKILDMGINDVKDFDFVDAPCSDSLDMAIENLIFLGAVTTKFNMIELTAEGKSLVTLGIEPYLGKLILGCLRERLGKEGLVLAAVMPNSSSIFYRVGNQAEKLKADCLKVPFCHRDGDLFTLLSVYKEWENVTVGERNKWCWANSINARSMRRCHDTVMELELCLKTELGISVPGHWTWEPAVVTEYDKVLKKVILSSLPGNVAVYSGYDQLGYEVASTGQYAQLHPSCSLLMFSQKPSWVVFRDILSTSNHYLTCVTAFDSKFLENLSPPPPFDVSRLENRMLQLKTLSGFGSLRMKTFCGKANSALHSFLSRIRSSFEDERINIDVDVDNNEIRIHASILQMEKVVDQVEKILDHLKAMLQNECIEKCLYHGGSGVCPPVALFGAGAEIKHLELDKRCLTVDVYHSDISSIDDKELLMLVERRVVSGICAVHRSASNIAVRQEAAKWGSITCLTPEAAESALKLNNVEFCGSSLQIKPSGETFGVDRAYSFPPLRVKVDWPRRLSKGFAFVTCKDEHVLEMVSQFSNLRIGERYVRSQRSNKSSDCVIVSGIDRRLGDSEILEALRNSTNRPILKFNLARGDAVDGPSCSACEETLSRKLSVFMPKGSPISNFCRVQVFPPKPNDSHMKAMITFDGRLHLEAAKALGQIEGTVLPGHLPWQRIYCQGQFQSSVSCPCSVYFKIRNQLDSLISCLNRRGGVECVVSRNTNGSFRVNISTKATKIMAEVRRPLEELMKGTPISHPGITPAVLQPLYSRDGINLMRSLQEDTDTCIVFDRYAMNVTIFGLPRKVKVAEERLVRSLLSMQEKKWMDICLRGGMWPHNMMKVVVDKFGPDLHGLKEKFPDVDFRLSTRFHKISISSGGNRETKKSVEEIVKELACSVSSGDPCCWGDDDASCPICLCEVEEEYKLESCRHSFCRACLVDQCESATRSRDNFPLRCFHKDCGMPLLVADLKGLLLPEKLDELFQASLSVFVASSGGKYRFCPSPDCPSVYRVAGDPSSSLPTGEAEQFTCGACLVDTCKRCHLEYHQGVSCELYREFKKDPDMSLKIWQSGKEIYVKRCPFCGFTIEKDEGCNHVECKCGRHLCWVCLDYFLHSDDCYTHLREVHQGIV